jgi:uncharacterized coiled-coil protein SlyX
VTQKGKQAMGTTHELVRRLEAAEQRSALAARKARGTVLAALLVMVGLLALSLAPVAQAQKGGGGPSLEARVATLESENATQATQIAALQSENTALKSQVAALETKTQHLSTGTDANNKPALFITGANVYIQDGSGYTPSTRGLGNLTIGYNRLRDTADSPDIRTGSHNLIVGDFNNYGSFGGLVVGYRNTISGPFAAVSGGTNNTASNQFAAVSGGYSCTASGWGSSVSGGQQNTASGDSASVSGGVVNTASGNYASVSGGGYNTASGDSASVIGGKLNEASGWVSAVGGGFHQSATGTYDWVAGTQVFEGL